jgi:hypothetical protein
VYRLQKFQGQLIFFLRVSRSESKFCWGCDGSVGDVVAQLAKARLSEPDCTAAVPGSIPASSTGAAGIMTVYQKSKLTM